MGQLRCPYGAPEKAWTRVRETSDLKVRTAAAKVGVEGMGDCFNAVA